MAVKLWSERDLRQRILAVTDPAANLDPPMLNGLLSALVEAGFQTARLYDVTLNLPTKDLLLVLSATSDQSRNQIGFTIDYRTSTAGHAGRNAGATLGSSKELKPEQEAWARSLVLDGKDWVDVPIRFGNRLIALLACDWPTGALDLTADDLTFIDLIASRLAVLFMLAPARMVERARQTLPSADAESDLHEFLQKSAEGLCTAIEGDIAGVFQHRWETGCLEKILEVRHPKFGAPPNELSELYCPESSCLTAHAWRLREYRHIVSFERLGDLNPEHVSKLSRDRHEALFRNPMVTALYGLLGTTEPRFMIRVLNRADLPSLPFVDRHKRAFDTLCSDLSKSVDRLVTSRRLKRLQQISNSVVEAMRERAQVIALVKRSLEDEDVLSGAILCHSEGSVAYSAEEYFGPLFKDYVGRKPGSDGNGIDPFYTFAANSPEYSFLDLKSVKNRFSQSSVLSHLVKQRVTGAMCFPIRAARTRGVLICPVPPRDIDGGVPALRTSRPSADKLSTLTTYATMVGSCIESIDSRLTADHARMLVGHIGHEVNTPASVLGQLALDAIREARNAVGDDNSELLNRLNALRQGVVDQMGAVDKTMRVALLVAQESKGRLQLHFRKYDLGRLLKEARDSLSAEMEQVNSRGRVSVYRIELGDSCFRLGTTVCDPELLKQVLVNLFRNGMKYSLPRFRGEPMKVDVVGIRQTGMSIIQVTNWGIGIPPDDFERIFQPFVRGSIHDRFRAIRGMGLGLYVSRRVVLAHKGTLVCRKSEFTLDDPARQEAWEGFETIMELRLPQGLAEGVTEHVWDEKGLP